jgi:hypothetical protein
LWSPNSEDSIDLKFLLLDGSVAFARDEDEAMEVLEEVCVPVRIATVVWLDWVPEIFDGVFPLANQEWILVLGGSTSGNETAVIDSKLSKWLNVSVIDPLPSFQSC